MKISIDVLPDEQKKKRDQEKKIGTILKIGTIFALSLFVLNVVFFLMQIVLNIEYQTAKKAKQMVSDSAANREEKLEEVFRQVGKQTVFLAKIKSETPNWARIIVKISQICPNEIRIDKIVTEENHLKISGFSKTREVFLGFQDRLNEEKYQSPSNIANLVASQDFSFELDIIIPKEELIQQ